MTQANALDPAPPTPTDRTVAASNTPRLRSLLDTLQTHGYRWWHLALLIALVALGVFATRDGWADLLWLAANDEESSQIMVVPVIVVWLFAVRIGRLRTLRPGLSVVGPLLIAAGWAIEEYGYVDSLRVAGHLAAVALLAGAVLSVAGDRFLWRLLPVFGTLIFAIPVPYRIRLPLSIPLQRITAMITEHLMQVLSLPVTRSGSVLHINGVDVGIAEACNGMRMVFAVLLVAYLFAYKTAMPWYIRVLLLLLAPVLALLCNVIRMVPTVTMYGYASQDAAEWFHDIGGFVMIGVAFGMLTGVMWLLRDVIGYKRPDHDALREITSK
jgi:exosortase